MWDAQQREYLQAMGLRVERWAGAATGTESSAIGPALSAALQAHLLRAARVQDVLQLPAFPSRWDVLGKRTYWRTLRTLRARAR